MLGPRVGLGEKNQEWLKRDWSKLVSFASKLIFWEFQEKIEIFMPIHTYIVYRFWLDFYPLLPKDFMKIYTPATP